MKPKSHASADYICPICAGIKLPGGPNTLMVESDFVYRDKYVSAIINTFFMGDNPGHVIVIPNQHYENIYDLDAQVGHHIFDAVQKVALAMKQAYQCDGITTRQNNEPAGDQHGLHFHIHIVPRYINDSYNKFRPKDKRLADAAERASYAEKLRPLLQK